MYKPGGTVAQAVARIKEQSYVLPAIQREFVWEPEQIERLFDSLMQGYPFGTFLFWKVEPGTSGTFKFYDFVRTYHERDAAHCPDLGALPNQALTAVLDGQQRLTALNIGLRGSMALKEPNKRWTNDDAFPRRTLRLDLLAAQEPDEGGAIYVFKFLEETKAAHADGKLWFNVPDILNMANGPAMLQSLMGKGLTEAETGRAYATLDRLHRVIHSEQLINYYEEESQSLERVLNLFIRLNSGGTVLSYSDLLLSIAVAQWTQIDARAEIHSLVDRLNGVGSRFNLSQDFVLKAGLMLADIASVGFKVENFTHANMAELEAKWPQIRRALIQAIELASSFGLNGQTLRADSALLPIAYYLYRAGVPDNFVTSGQYADDRAQIRDWLIRSLLKGGVWGSGLDTLLTALRETIQNAQPGQFPAAALRKTLADRGKSLQFSSEEIEAILSWRYGSRDPVFALLSLLYSFIDLRNHFHIDHVFPVSKFTATRLRKAGVPEEKIEAFAEMANQLPNLQLLEGQENIEKRAKTPKEWLAAKYVSPEEQMNYRSLHNLGELPDDVAEFGPWFDKRRSALSQRLTAMINLDPAV